MDKFFAELKRRHVFRVAAAYAVVAWVLIQLVNNIAPMLNLPGWAGTLVLVLLLVGFPIALIFAWTLEMKARAGEGAAAKPSNTRTDFVLAVALAVVIGLILYQQFAPASGERAARQANVTAPAASSPAGVSIAVLPFVNLSGDTGQEFFSDGMTEEITAALTKVPGLRVLGRTSAFEFKGQNKDLRTIGQALGATHLIEGSVRKAGNRVRITAQLVKAADDSHLWAENYDRDLTDVFAIQEDIAKAIAVSLRVPLGLKQGENLVNNRSIDLESYQQYLRARALVRARGSPREPGPLAEAARLLESVVARDPNYAPAWALLAQAYGYTPIYTRDTGAIDELRRLVDASFPRAEAAARKAIALDPNGSDGYMSLALAQQMHGNFLEAEESALKALALDPNNADELNQYSYQLEEVGRLKDALALRQRLLALEPFVPTFNIALASSLWLNGQSDAAIAMYKTFPPDRQASLARIYAAQGRYGEAADMLQAMRSDAYPPGQLQEAVRILRTAPAAAASPQSLPRLGGLGYIYLYVGAPGRVLEYYEGNAEIGAPVVSPTSDLWHFAYAPVRKTERFKALMRKAGFVDYWRAKGWPDLCHPVGADDFACN